MPCKIEDLPIVDLVVISHSHYDHLSHPTVVALHKAHPKAHFMVGLGLKKWFEDSGIKNVTEMDWWEDVDLVLSPVTGEKRISNASSTIAPNSTSSDITARISCLPCQHTSARTAFDKGVCATSFSLKLDSPMRSRKASNFVNSIHCGALGHYRVVVNLFGSAEIQVTFPRCFFFPWWQSGGALLSHTVRCASNICFGFFQATIRLD